jgi:hypothetical protein
LALTLFYAEDGMRSKGDNPMNIFAKELVPVLGAHGKELSSLFGLKVTGGYGVERRLLPSKVTRLKRSLIEDLMATLNPDELEVLEDWAELKP